MGPHSNNRKRALNAAGTLILRRHQRRRREATLKRLSSWAKPHIRTKGECNANNFAERLYTSQRTTRSIYTTNALSFRCALMILHLSRMCRNVNRNVYNDRKNVNAATTRMKQQHANVRQAIYGSSTTQQV